MVLTLANEVRTDKTLMQSVTATDLATAGDRTSGFDGRDFDQVRVFIENDSNQSVDVTVELSPVSDFSEVVNLAAATTVANAANGLITADKPSLHMRAFVDPAVDSTGTIRVYFVGYRAAGV